MFLVGRSKTCNMLRRATVLLLFSVELVTVEEISSQNISGIQTENAISESAPTYLQSIPVLEITWSTVERLTEKDGEAFDNYTAPYNFSERYVYYLAGYDHDDRPIWICEGGKWNVMEAVKNGHNEELSTYFLQLGYRILKSIQDRSTLGKPVTEAVLIVDYADLAFDQLRHLPTVSCGLKLLRDSKNFFEKYLGMIVALNVSFTAETMFSMIRPVIGGLFGRAEIYGNNKALWMPKLLRLFPKNSLPEWYGGEKGFKPVKVYG